jgi:hypothetical protein
MNKIWVSIVVALAIPIGTADAVDHPPVKEGLWQIRTQIIDNPGNKTTDSTIMLCRDHDYDKAAEASGKSVKGCTTTNESFTAGAYSAEMRCEIGSNVLVSKGVVTFKGDAATHSETHVTYTPALFGKTDETMIQDQTYLGDCPAGMNPGDRKSQDGTIVPLGKH